MQLSTKGRYAVRIMVYLAAHGNIKPVRKQAIAKAEGISPDYLAQLLLQLKAAGFVRSHRGIAGGFTIACDPETVTIARILEATEGPIAVVPCITQPCTRKVDCAMAPVWAKANAAFLEALSEFTLATVALKYKDNRGLVFDI